MIPIIIETDFSGGWLVPTYAYTISIGDELLYKSVGIIPLNEEWPEMWTIIRALWDARELFETLDVDILINTDASKDVRILTGFKLKPSDLKGKLRSHIERFINLSLSFNRVMFNISEPSICHRLSYNANLFLNWYVLNGYKESDLKYIGGTYGIL